jgi:uncharacterized protein HemX
MRRTFAVLDKKTAARLVFAVPLIFLALGLATSCVTLSSEKKDNLRRTEAALVAQQAALEQQRQTFNLEATLEIMQTAIQGQSAQATSAAATPPTLAPEQLQQVIQTYQAQAALTAPPPTPCPPVFPPHLPLGVVLIL